MLSSNQSSGMANTSYSNDRSSAATDTDYTPEAAASGGFFHSDFKKHDDLKEMLDSNKDNLKLEAMKRIIGMVAKGRDASVLFPAVVKNVVSKNIEIKKLVYVYLERYAEDQQDLALLSISTFQRALKEPNQLIRAGALRVLSSIRVKMISPIVMLAIRDASADMSPYVRKTAAHAIPKLYSLDPELKQELVTIIQKLLADKTVLVMGSAVMAFTLVCPEEVELIHQVYRKLCALIVDVDEWGQVIIVNMLTRYVRSQFANPNYRENEPDGERPFYEPQADEVKTVKFAPTLDSDHRLILRSTRPLLQSRNASVVMAVAQLYHHAAPKSEFQLVAKAMIRFLRSHNEVQCIMLNAIASISAKQKAVFESYLKSFFVRTSDPTNIKLLKLEILTNLATETNVMTILRELQTYISHNDKSFVASTIQAIGRCACSIKDVTDTCLNGLVSLLSNRDEAVVAESVVVIKRLLQNQAADPKEIITHMARLLDSITVAQARAAILWLLGEHSQKVPLIVPDVLRKLAKTFSEEDDIVKMQVLNLAVKLHVTNSEQTAKLCQYIFNLARYDLNYDIRDKTRFLKYFISGSKGVLARQALRICLASKPAPLITAQFRDADEYQLGSLSHYIKQKAAGYEPLPDFPEIPPPGDVRSVDDTTTEDEQDLNANGKNKKELAWESESDISLDIDFDDMDRNLESDSTISELANMRDLYMSSDDDDDDDDDDDEEESDEVVENDRGRRHKAEKPVSHPPAKLKIPPVPAKVSPPKLKIPPAELKIPPAELKIPPAEVKIPPAEVKIQPAEVKTPPTEHGTHPPSIHRLTPEDLRRAKIQVIPTSSSESSDSEESSEEEEESDESEEEDEEGDDEEEEEEEEKKEIEVVEVEKAKEKSEETVKTATPAPTTAECLIDSGPVTVNTGPVLTPVHIPPINYNDPAMLRALQPVFQFTKPVNQYPPAYDLLPKIRGKGLHATYRFTREWFFAKYLLGVRIVITNHLPEHVMNVELKVQPMSLGMKMYLFDPIEVFPRSSTHTRFIGIDFNDTLSPAHLYLSSSLGEFPVSVIPTIGDLLLPLPVTDPWFRVKYNKLIGMTRFCCLLPELDDDDFIARVHEVTNFGPVNTDGDRDLRFAAETASHKHLALLKIVNPHAMMTVCSENIVFASILFEKLKKVFNEKRPPLSSE